MRGRFHFIVVLALLLGSPTGALAQAPSESPPCAIPPLPGWNAHEQFVWAQICRDEVADLGKEPGSEGVIDPRDKHLPGTRVLSRKFIETILTDDTYRAGFRRHGVRVTGARFIDQIDLQNTKFDVELWFDQCQFDGGIDLSWVQSTQPIGFTRSTAAEPLNFYSAQLGSDLIIKESVLGLVTLTGAHIGRTLDLSQSNVTARGRDALELSGITVGTDLLMSRGRYVAIRDPNDAAGDPPGVDLHGSRVEHSIDLTQANIHGTLKMANVHVATDLRMSQTTFRGEVDLQYSQIGGELDFDGASFAKDVDLTRAQVGGAFLLGSPTQSCPEDRPGSAAAPGQITLTARYAKFAVIPGLTDAWPCKLDLVGMTYDSIDGDDDFDLWFKRQDYSRQPYERLAGVLQSEGEIERSTAVRYAERDRDRSEQSGWIWAWLTLLKYLIGYGYYPQISLFWVAGFILLGMGVLWASGEGRRNGMPVGASYSFDMLLPIIELRRKHYDIDLAGWPRYYFYFHRIVGWALASFLVAGLAGLTK